MKIQIIKSTYFATIAKNIFNFETIGFCVLFLKIGKYIECRHSKRTVIAPEANRDIDAGSAKGSEQANQMTKRNWS